MLRKPRTSKKSLVIHVAFADYNQASSNVA